MPREGYRTITVKEDLYQGLGDQAEDLGITIPQFIKKLYDAATCEIEITVHDEPA